MIRKTSWSIQNYFMFISVAMAIGSIATISVALAAYKPPADQRRPNSPSIIGGRRGGCDRLRWQAMPDLAEPRQSRDRLENIPLTALAPKTHVGQTISTHPTFAWFVPNASESLPVEFRLFEYDANDKPRLLSEVITLDSPSGISKYIWSKDKPELKVNKTYLWEVRIRCDHNRPSNDLKARADLRVIPMSPTITKDTVPLIESVAKVKAYGESGLWYGALGEALRTATPSQLGTVGAELIHQLATVEADQLDSISEDKERQQLEQWVEDLRQIAEGER